MISTLSSNRVAVIGNTLWRRRFAGDPSLPGRTILLEHESYKVVGVLAPGFNMDSPSDIWLPLQADPNSKDHVSRVVFAGAALLLAAVGLYGLMTYSVQQRTQEIGIRMALGAGPRDVRNMVAWQGMRLALIGISIGIPAALALTRLMVGMIFGIKTWDPIVFIAVAALMSAVALLAAYAPSVRATRVDPVESLRH